MLQLVLVIVLRRLLAAIPTLLLLSLVPSPRWSLIISLCWCDLKTAG